ncbi:MFS transporter [Beduini massiliensis]|uniref:MFS transporter n=1 Tax=Beduini massiliensis TaxID=1585974 RepID=UPI00059AAEF0|nr:MFS transporter [Beduini massiliensis]
MNKEKRNYWAYVLMYLFYFFSLALFSGLISIYLMDKGYTASQVSFVVSSSFVVSMLFQPLIGYLNDRYALKKVNSLCLFLSALLGISFIWMKNIYLIALVYSLALALFNGTNPVIERMATFSPFTYGHIRIWGTIGYALGSQIGGIIYRYISPESMYICFAISLLFCLLGIYGTRDIKRNEKSKPTSKGAFKSIFLNKPFVTYLLIASMFYGITNINSTYLPSMFQNEGIAVNIVSTIIFFITLSELPIIFFSHKYMDQLTNKQLLIGVMSLLVIQFFTYSIIHVEMVQIMVAILTKAVATMTFIMLNMKIIASLVDASHQMTALAIVSTFKSFTSILFQSVGGMILDHTNYQILFMFLLISSVITLLICCIMKLPKGNTNRLFQ